jgi:hypothetical protein
VGRWLSINGKTTGGGTRDRRSANAFAALMVERTGGSMIVEMVMHSGLDSGTGGLVVSGASNPARRRRCWRRKSRSSKAEKV